MLFRTLILPSNKKLTSPKTIISANEMTSLRRYVACHKPRENIYKTYLKKDWHPDHIKTDSASKCERSVEDEWKRNPRKAFSTVLIRKEMQVEIDMQYHLAHLLGWVKLKKRLTI